MTNVTSVYEGSACHRHLLRAIRDAESAFLVGPPGCGISTLLKRLEAAEDGPFQGLFSNISRYSCPAKMLVDILGRLGEAAQSESVTDLLEQLISKLWDRSRKTPVIILDQCHQVEDDFLVSLLPAVRSLQTRRSRESDLLPVAFVIAGSLNPQQLSARIGTSPVENQANRIHMPDLTFEDIDMVIRAENKRLERSDDKMPEEVRRRLYGLAENDLRLLGEIVRWLPDELPNYEDQDEQIIRAALNALSSSSSRDFRDRLDEAVEQPAHRRLMARILLSRSPRAETSWYHDSSRAAVDLRAAGILVLARHTKILRFRNETIVLALSKHDAFNRYLTEEAGLDPLVLKEFYRSFHVRGGHSLYVAFRRCHDVEVALRSFLAGFALSPGGEDALVRVLHQIRIRDGAEERTLRTLRGAGGVSETVVNACMRKLAEDRLTLHDALIMRMNDVAGQEAIPIVDLLPQMTLRETADVIEKVAEKNESSGDTQEIFDFRRIRGVVEKVREFAELRNRVAHFKQFTLKDQERLRILQQQVLDCLGAR